MPITVEGPGGQTIEFPDGTSEDVISREADRIFGASYRPPPPSKVESFLRGAAEGATFGFDGKLSDDWKRNRETSRKENPWTHFAGELVGGIVPMVATGGTGIVARGAVAARKAGVFTTKGAQAVKDGAEAAGRLLNPRSTTTLGGAIVQGAKVGAVHGGLSGVGHAEPGDDADVAETIKAHVLGGAKGAVVGAPVGAGLGAVGHGVGRAAQNVVGARAAAAAETGDTHQGALRTIQRSFERDSVGVDDIERGIRETLPAATGTPGGLRPWGQSGQQQPWIDPLIERVAAIHLDNPALSPAEIAKRLAQEYPGATVPGTQAIASFVAQMAERHAPLNLTDRAALVRPGAGENTQMMMRAAAATPGRARADAREAMLDRQVGTGDRVQGALERTVGSSDFDGVASQHATKLQQAGEAAYKAARAAEQPFDLQPIVNTWTQTYNGRRGPVPEGIMRAVQSIEQSPPVRNMNTGAVITSQRVPPRTLDDFIHARQNVRQIIEETPHGSPLRRDLERFYREITDEVARTNPEWARANAIWRDGRAAEEAMEAGAAMSTRLNTASREHLDVFRQAERDLRKAGKGSPEAAAAEARMELFRVGLVRALMDRLVNNKQATADLVAELRLPGAREMLAEVLGRREFVTLMRFVEAESVMTRTYRSQFGSQTTPLREAIDDLNWAPSQTAAFDIMNIRAILQRAMDHVAGRYNAARNKAMMPMLVDPNPINQLATLRAIRGIDRARAEVNTDVRVPATGAGGPVANAATAESGASAREAEIRRRRMARTENDLRRGAP